MNNRMKDTIRRILPRTIKPHRIRAGDLRGQWIVTSWHDYPGALTGRTEKPLLYWFGQHVKPAETWLDVGAHYGYTTLALCNLVGAHGRVFAFEPMIGTAGHLQETRRLNNLCQLTVLPLALGKPDHEGLLHLPVSRGMLDSTLDVQDWHETFMVTWLDILWPRICGKNKAIHGVKIDVQGMEIDTILGMQNLLACYGPKLVVELHKGVDRARLLALLEQIGYSRHATPIEPVEGEVGFLDDKSYEFHFHAHPTA